MHTKGPWKMDNATILDTEGTGTILVYGPEGPGFGRTAMAYAECGRYDDLLPNARLIAATPELLEALEKIVDAHLQPINLWSHKKLNLALPDAREAIRKARGE